MIKILLFFIVFVLGSLSSYAQIQRMKYSNLFNKFYLKEPANLSFGLGTSAYRGDICGRPNCNTFMPSFGIGANIKPQPFIGFGAELLFFKLEAFQHKEKENIIHFFSNNLEISFYSRIYLIDDVIKTATDRNKGYKKIKIYLLLGTSLVYHNTQSGYINRVSEKVYEENKEYPDVAIAFPVGGGMTLRISPRVSIVGESKYVFTMTDYLDDAGAVRGNSKNNPDTFVTAMLKIQYSPWAPRLNRKKYNGQLSK